MITILIPAAGASSRMAGTDKLMRRVDGVPLLARTVDRALATGARVIVTLPATDHPRAAALAGKDVTVVAVPDRDRGMSRSLVRGAAQADPALPLMILPADMPDLDSDDLRTLIAARTTAPVGAILRGSGADGTPGHPVLFPPSDLPGFARLEGDQGAREILARAASRLVMVPLPGTHALTDLDTADDWARWEAQHQEGAT
ncbi:nucleotidyltransferase family protein [Shimia biformata]|uniref:nucleotidyltransferase family protein n=1 Tax=Shimia biformata TaxID=1294299 RepID=UPI001950F911|nr:nucleotidyltransferase family protein [Shimia biformata]